jgi:hypothetical protein
MLYMYDPLCGDNTWKVPPNTWFGAHNGTYLANRDAKIINFFGEADGGTKKRTMQFNEINYPDDCEVMPGGATDLTGGPGTYVSSFQPGIISPLRWYRYSPPPWNQPPETPDPKGGWGF